MKTSKLILVSILFSLLISSCGGGVDDSASDTGDFTILSVDPAENSTPTTVCAITATFNRPIEVSTVDFQSFEITPSTTSTPLLAAEGTWALDPSSSAQIKFVPISPLPETPAIITVTISTAITDTSANALPTGKTWSFTATLPCTP